MKLFSFSSKRLLSMVLASLLLCSFTVQYVQALDERFYTGNDIIFYDPDATCVPGTPGSVVPGSGQNPPPEKYAETVWAFFLGKGLTPEQAAGVMGNIQQESNFNPEAEEFPGENRGGYGIVQWTGGRRDKLVQEAGKQGVPPSNLAFQLEFLFQESNSRKAKPEYGGGNEWEGLKKVQTIGGATRYWHDNFERSADNESVIQRRIGYAQDWFNKFNGKVGASSSAGCGVGDTSTIATTVKSYAWKTFQATTTTKKPEYVTAVNKARSEGRYVGGGQYPGVDCGGFVTTVMYDSGFDKAYNSNARGGNTGPQRTWLENNWTKLGSGSGIDAGSLRMGDVAMSDGHTFMFVGKEGLTKEFIADFGVLADGSKDTKFTGVASASYLNPWRAPMAGHESVTDPDFTWYRKR
ncbi:MAG TPA: phage tail tip lysozyme [Candidatus Saccharimonadales bacterium]|nr:phage tail tip lysozyme [Candidatus Saccharimonadales bacterium]